MKKLWPFTAGQRLWLMLAPFFMLFFVLSDVLQPTLMASIVDKGIANGNFAYVKKMSLIMLFTTIGGFLAGMVSFYLSAKTTAAVGASLRSALFRKVRSFTHEELDHFSVSTLITRLTNDVNQIQNVLLAGQRILIRVPMMLFGGLFMAIRLSPRLSLIFFIAIPLLSMITFIVMKRALRIFPRVQEKIDAINGFVRESLLGIRVLKGYHTEQAMEDRFYFSNNDVYRWQLKAQKNMLILSPFVMIIFNYSMIAILWIGGWQVHLGHLKIGAIMAFVAYLSQIINAILMSSFVLMMISRAVISMQRIDEVLQIKPALNDHPDMLQTIPDRFDLDIDHLSFRYKNNAQPVLHDVSLYIPEGERLGIIGSTGAGKSTLVHLLLRFYDIDCGNIRLGKVPIQKLSIPILRKQIGLIQQHTTILSGSLADNLRLVKPEASNEEMIHALEKAQLQELYEDRHGLDGVLQQRGGDLSGGQKQRLAIARAFLHAPRILIMDDSTSALDVLTEQAILAELKNQPQKQTQIIIGQRISTMQTCHRILVLEDGKIVGLGTHESLLKNCPLYQSIVESQKQRQVIL